MINEKLTEEVVVNKIIEFMINKPNGNWHEEKVKKNDLHEHGVDINLVGGKQNSEYFFIECKGKSYAKSANSINKEGWLNALGQIVTRMNTKRLTKSKEDGKRRARRPLSTFSLRNQPSEGSFTSHLSHSWHNCRIIETLIAAGSTVRRGIGTLSILAL